MALFLYVFLFLFFCCLYVFLKWLFYLKNYDEAVKFVNCIVKNGSALQKYKMKNHFGVRDYDVRIMSQHFCKLSGKHGISNNQISHCGTLLMSFFQEKLEFANNRLKRFYLHSISSAISIALSFVIYKVIRLVGDSKGFWQSDIYDETAYYIAAMAILCVALSLILSIPSFKVHVNNEELAYQLWLISMSIYLGDTSKSPVAILSDSYDFAPVSIRLEIAQLIQKIKKDENIIEPYSYVMSELKNKETDSVSVTEMVRLKTIGILDMAPYFSVFMKVVLDVIEVIKLL